MGTYNQRNTLFEPVWAEVVRAAIADRISALTYLTNATPTLREYLISCGKTMCDMINVVRLGITRLSV